jgi:hypothetical protein
MTVLLGTCTVLSSRHDDRGGPPTDGWSRGESHDRPRGHPAGRPRGEPATAYGEDLMAVGTSLILTSVASGSSTSDSNSSIALAAESVAACRCGWTDCLDEPPGGVSQRLEAGRRGIRSVTDRDLRCDDLRPLRHEPTSLRASPVQRRPEVSLNRLATGAEGVQERSGRRRPTGWLRLEEPGNQATSPSSRRCVVGDLGACRAFVGGWPARECRARRQVAEPGDLHGGASTRTAPQTAGVMRRPVRPRLLARHRHRSRAAMRPAGRSAQGRRTRPNTVGTSRCVRRGTRRR